jgi:putative PIG3 family NAD(P)H quinone oxidoreductase
MRAVVFTSAGGPEVVGIRHVEPPRPGPEELLVRVCAAGLNRADILHRDGEYQVPAGESTIPGVEIAGVVENVGSDVIGHHRGKRVFGVVAGGAFAEYCLIDHAMANPLPRDWTYAQGAATAESWLTADESLFTLGGLTGRQRVLVHAAASGVGTTMLQMAKSVGATVFATVGSPAKADAVKALGADVVLNRRTDDIRAEVTARTGGRGVDLVMDFVGGARLDDNLAMLRTGGCLLLVGLLDGLSAPLDLLRVVERRLQIKGTSLRLRPIREKRAVNRRFQQRWLAPLSSGELEPLIHACYPFDDIRTAMREMEDDRNVGKIVLRLTDDRPDPSP